MKRFALLGFPEGLANQDIAPTLNLMQGGFIQEKKNAKTLVLSLQTPSNEFGAKSKSPLKWTE
jgi:hypothetical protein